jgi:hypothetical protein
MSVDINWIAVLLAAASSMVVGMIWYAKPVFGNAWIKLTNQDESKMGEGAGRAIALTALLSFLTAYVLAHVAFLSNQFFGNSFLQDAVTTAFWMWLGFTAARILTHDLFEGRPVKLSLLTVSHEFVTLVVMGLVIGLLAP